METVHLTELRLLGEKVSVYWSFRKLKRLESSLTRARKPISPSGASPRSSGPSALATGDPESSTRCTSKKPKCRNMLRPNEHVDVTMRANLCNDDLLYLKCIANLCCDSFLFPVLTPLAVITMQRLTHALVTFAVLTSKEHHYTQ